MDLLRRAIPVLVAALVAFALIQGADSPARGQIPLPPLDSSTTTTTSPPPSVTLPGSSSTTTSTTTAPRPSSTTTTTTAPEPDGSQPGGPEPGQTGPEAPGESVVEGHDGGDGQAPDDAPPFPSSLEALMQSVNRTGPSSTQPLLDALSPLVTRLGYRPSEAVAVGFGRFPVGGLARWTHDWWLPRFGPGWRLHEGTDIFAPSGTPVRAPADGTVKLVTNSLGGLCTYVIEDDGTYYYLAHLSGYPAGLVDGQRVKTGDTVGYVGQSGNAATTPPHLHFEIHPGGGGPVDPKPLLDAWVQEAAQQVPGLIASIEARVAPPLLALPILDQRVPGAPSPGRVAVMWATAANPWRGGIALVTRRLSAEMRAVDAAPPGR